MDGPPPQLTPEELAALPHDDRGPALVATSWSLTCLAAIFLGLRVYCKMIRHRFLWWDDWILIAAWVTLAIDSALATVMVVDHTYGRHTWDFRTPDLDQFVLIVAVRATFTVAAIAWTKTAFAITLLRLSDGWMKKVLWFIIVTMNIALAITAMTFWVQCTPLEKSWKPSIPGSCKDPTPKLHYDIFSGACSAACDFVLALLPWKLLLGLQLKKTEKFGAAIAMSMGFLAGIAGVIKTVKLPKLASPDMYDAADLVIWDISEAAVSMIGACLPVLRTLIRDVRSTIRSGGTTQPHYTASEGASRSRRTNNSTRPAWELTARDSSSKHPSGSLSSRSREHDDEEGGSEKASSVFHMVAQGPSQVQRR
ncbi:hypothetical protein QBC34DRAFT_498002 [Podospora aff. communis PSN243]|uniref:Rhodopsin domain-containing protein n=1 Tax=Podospora aff. communis PSN243 TaxID=3040156 RepID=A0AAV9GA46_9PEZI|nr:hypothetical protein QBC34DRAFT_498002 [Podospora aff. communis PSN243]